MERFHHEVVVNSCVCYRLYMRGGRCHQDVTGLPSVRHEMVRAEDLKRIETKERTRRMFIEVINQVRRRVIVSLITLLSVYFHCSVDSFLH